MQSKQNRSDIVSFMRGVSILAIMLYHLINDVLDVPNILKVASGFGGAGVHVFFICSGFGLALSQIKKPLSFTQFIKKRFPKIYLPYIFVVFAAFFLPYTYSGADRVTALLSHVFLFKMFVPAYESSFSVPFWYISTLFQFYFLFIPLTKAKCALGNRRFILLSLASSIAWPIFLTAAGLYEERIFNSAFPQYLWEFSIGVCLAERFFADPKGWLSGLKAPVVAVVSAVCFVLYAAMALKGGAMRVFNDFFSAGAFAGVCYLLYLLPFLHAPMRLMDRISFELYLLHALIYSGLRYLGGGGFLSLPYGMCAFALSIAAAAVYHRVVTAVRKRLP